MHSMRDEMMVIWM